MGVDEPKPKEPKLEREEDDPAPVEYDDPYQTQTRTNSMLVEHLVKDVIGSIGQLSHAKAAFAIKLENVETHEQYDSKYFKSSGYHNNIVFLIPAGTYKVISVGVALQTDINQRFYYYDDSSVVSDFFGPLVIRPKCRYYLGNYDCYDEKNDEGISGICKMKYLEPAIFINKSEPYIPKEITNALSNSDWEGDGFHILRPANPNNVLFISPIDNNTNSTNK